MYASALITQPSFGRLPTSLPPSLIHSTLASGYSARTMSTALVHSGIAARLAARSEARSDLSDAARTASLSRGFILADGFVIAIGCLARFKAHVSDARLSPGPHVAAALALFQNQDFREAVELLESGACDFAAVDRDDRVRGFCDLARRADVPKCRPPTTVAPVQLVQGNDRNRQRLAQVLQPRRDSAKLSHIVA